MPALQATAHIETNRLRIDYQVINDQAQIIYAYILPVSTQGLYSRDAYRCLSADYKTLNLMLGEIPPPEDIRLFARITPLASPIKEDQSLTSYLQFNLPVQEWHAYTSREYPNNGHIANVINIKLSIEYILEENIIFNEKTDQPNFFHVGGGTTGILSWETTLDYSLPVLIRETDFSRFTL